jgi:integrase
MRKVAERAFPELLSVTPEQFNDEMEAMHEGTNPNVKDGGLAKTTLQVTQPAARCSFWYHDLGRPEEIHTFGTPSEPKHDEADLFTRDDVQALRDHVTDARNRAILEMLRNTGQRISAIQGLRIGDVDTEAGWFSLNTDRDGLKGAADRIQPRPLFGAEPYLADWIDVHPFADDPEAYPFIGNPDHHHTKPDQPRCQGAIRSMLENSAAEAGVDKPVDPHDFRHYWTTIAKQDYGLDDEENKLLLGHERESNGLNLTYNHTVSERLLSNTERKLDGSDASRDKPLTPDQCTVCDEVLESHWLCCPVSGTQYGPG